MFKKIISLTVAMLMMLSTALFVCAAGEGDVAVTVTQVGYTIKVSVQTPTKSAQTLKVYALNADRTATTGRPVAIEQKNSYTSVSDAVYTYSFNDFNFVQGQPSGYYRVIINNKHYQNFLYKDIVDYKPYIGSLGTSTSVDIRTNIQNGVDNDLIDVEKVEGYLNETDTDAKEKMDTCVAAVDLGLSDSSTTEEIAAAEKKLYDEIERVVKVAEVDTADKDEFKEKFLENTTSLGLDMKYYKDESIGLSANDVFTYFDELEVTDYSAETFKEAVDTAVLLAIINNSNDASKITSALTHYNNEGSVPIKTSATKGFSQNQLNEVSTLIKENPDNLTIADADGIADAYSHYASKVAGNSNGGGTGGGGPSGGPGYGNKDEGGKEEDKPVTPPEEGEQTGKFTDIKEAAWAESYITYLADKGVINGKGDNKYCPNDIVSREELTKIFVEAFGFLDEDATTDFSDINKDNWSYKYIASATKAGIINGVSAEAFSPQGRMTRQDMAVMVYRLAKLLNVELKASEVTFADADLISDYAVEAIGALSAAGLLNGTGDNCYSPLATLTRAQAAKITYELLNAIGGIEK